MKRKFFVSCVLALISITVAAGWPVVAARADSTITVTTTGDVIANDGECSLREAIIAANTDSASGGCAGGSGADTIVFDAALAYPVTIVLTQTGANEDAALTGDLDISGTLTISGTGQGQIMVDGNQTDRAFEVQAGARVTVVGLTVQHGNPGTAAGGGFVVDQTGTLTLTNSLVVSNTAASGGGLKVMGALRMSNSVVQGNQGGGISNEGGALTLNQVDVIGNTGGYGVSNSGGSLAFNTGLVAGNQGGIYNANNVSGTSLFNLTILNNTGSGVYNTGGLFAVVLTLRQSQVMSNTAAVGAGVYNEGSGATMTIYQTRLAYNVASSSGGGAWNWGSMSIISSTIDHNRASNGAGLRHNKGNLALTNATLSFNTASNNGGGLYSDSETSALLTNVTVDSNHTNGAPATGGNLYLDNTSLSLKNTIVSNGGPEGNCGFNLPASLNSVDHNLDSGTTCGFAATGDITNTDPLLGPLQDNGGSTPTQALLSNSPAIDQGTNSGCPITDQRGLHRPQGSSCDIGAYESSASTTLYTLSLAYAGSGSGAVTKSPDFTAYPSGTLVTLTANPDTGSRFFSWSGDILSATNPATIVMNADKSITATFVSDLSPIADAGQPQAVVSNQLVTLDGSGSYDPNNNLPLAFDWQQIAGEPVIMSSHAISRPAFTAPGVTMTQMLTFSLVVTNSIGLASPPAAVNVTVDAYRCFLPVVLRQ
jgi:CSLREA domain-containing protein